MTKKEREKLLKDSMECSESLYYYTMKARSLVQKLKTTKFTEDEEDVYSLQGLIDELEYYE